MSLLQVTPFSLQEFNQLLTANGYLSSNVHNVSHIMEYVRRILVILIIFHHFSNHLYAEIST